MTAEAALPPASAFIEALTTDEKVALVSGADLWRTNVVERLDIPPLKMSDGPVGVRGDGTTTAACFPAPVALAASFDPDLAVEVGRALADELASKGAHLLLGPTVNLARHPLGGRNFECYGEDPVLCAAMGAAVIAGVQHDGRGACVKHYVANDTEYRRMSVSVEADERTLREVYLAPFEAAVAAGVWAVMAAYPRIGGTYATEHAGLLRDILRGEWGFAGAVLSDWGATHHRSALAAGLDLEMPGPARAFGDHLRQGLGSGEVTVEDLDRAVGAVLGLLQRAGLLAGAAAGAVTPGRERAVDRPEHRDLIRRAAAAGTVLVRNEGLLPLDPAALRRVAVIGPNGHPGRIQGGGSAQVPAHRATSPLDGLRRRFGPTVEVTWSPGCLTHKYVPEVPVTAWDGGEEAHRPLVVDTFDSPDLSGEPVERRSTARVGALTFGARDDLAHPLSWSRRWRGRYRAVRDGTHTVGVAAVGRSRALFDGQVVADAWTDPRPGDAFYAKAAAEGRGLVDLVAGQVVDVVVEWSRGDDPDLAGLRFGIQPPVDEGALLDEAVRAAAAADVAVVVVGLDPEWETEGVDRTGWDLPGRQAELVDRVLATNARTVVVVNAGGVVALPWLERAPATVITWYPGQELGDALAAVLAGDVDPGGRSPVTFPARMEDAPTWLDVPGDGERLHYREGVFVGHRWYDARRVEPLVPFGHGLSYAELRLGGPVLVDDSPDTVTVTVPVRNRSDRPGRAVVQLYLEPPAGPLTRPVRQLAAFAALGVPAGSEVHATLTVPRRRFEVWDPDRPGWVLPPGRYDLRVGSSSRELGAAVTVQR